MAVHWLYPTNPRRGCWVDAPPGDVLGPGTVRSREREGPDGLSTWRLSSGFRTLAPGDLVWLYAAGAQVLYAVARAHAVRHDPAEGSWVVDVQWCHELVDRLDDEPVPRALFGQVPQGVQRADPTTTAVLEGWLAP